MQTAFFTFPAIRISRMSHICHPQEMDETGCFRAVEPDYKPLITNAALRRRMSRAVRMGVACGLECLAEVPSGEVGGILTATGWGCLGDTQKFMDALLDNHEQLLNPTPFMQSTFNTVGAQIALCKDIHACNMTYVQKGHSFENALIDAALHISEGKDNLLVGAFDEITPLSCHVLHRLGISFTLGEGAQFFLLQKGGILRRNANFLRREKNFARREKKIARRDIFLRGAALFSGKVEIVDVQEIADDFLKAHELTVTDVEVLLNGQRTAGDAVSDRLSQHFPNAVEVPFKKECGDYPTAIAYALWKACRLLQERNEDAPCRILIYNCFLEREHTFLLVSNVCG